VAENIRQVLAEVLGRELRDPRVGSVTITRVEVSGFRTPRFSFSE
jgi:ribosome-binding factor A